MYKFTSATSSILVPPAGDAIKIGPPAPLSSMIEIYISLLIYIRSTSMTFEQGMPSAVVCFVIKF
jgi:hypothetical protein